MTEPIEPSVGSIVWFLLRYGLMNGLLLGGGWFVILYLTGGWPLGDLPTAASAGVVSAILGAGFGVCMAVTAAVRIKKAIARQREDAARKTEENEK